MLGSYYVLTGLLYEVLYGLEGETMQQVKPTKDAREIMVGDTVKTLNRRQAIYGRVDNILNKIAEVRGRTQPGAEQKTIFVSLEDIEHVEEKELAPEDRREDAQDTFQTAARAVILTGVEEYKPESREELDEKFNRALRQANRGSKAED